MVTRKALIVGINIYQPPAGPNLQGCVNDAQNIAYTLNACGIVPANRTTIKILTDSRATKANILNGLAWLIKGAKKGDVLVYYHSGHGTQYVDVDGDEIERKDEAICPHDIATAGPIKDDDLRKVFTKLPEGVNLDVILDTCFSGTGTRVISTTGTDEPSSMTIRYMEPPLDYGFFLEADPSIPSRKILSGVPGEKVIAIANINHVLWAACRDNQTSMEGVFDGKRQGAFTYCFCKLLRRYCARAITRARLDALVGQCLKTLKITQIPQLEGTRKSMIEPVFT